MFEPGRLPDLTAFEESGEEGKGGVKLGVAPTSIQLTQVALRGPVHDVKLTAVSAAS